MITIKDIAKQAGVSVSTASRALNNNARISEATKTKIKKIAAQNGYLPNYNAKNLTTGEANVVGVIFPADKQATQDNPFFIEMLRGINEALMRRSFVLSVAIGKTQTTLLQNVKSMVEQAQIKKFIFLYTEKNDQISQYLRRKKLNFVVIGQPEQENHDRFVDNDNINAAKAATEFMFANHQVKQLVFIQSEHEWQYEINRRTGYEQAMRANKLTPIIFKLPDVETTKSLNRFLQQHPTVDGIISTDDLRLISFYQAWQSQAVPSHKLPAICFNNSQLVKLLGSQVTTVDMLPQSLGNGAVAVLFDRRVTHKVVAYKIN